MNLAVIIARGGSKGLPGKNLRDLLGRPMVDWTIEHALNSRLIDEVVLGSDDPAILARGRLAGIGCYPRPAELASDTATVDAAVRHAVVEHERATGTMAKRIAILYGNVPVRPADLTDRAMAKLVDTGADSVQCVYPVGARHPLWMRRLVGPEGDRLENYQPNEIYRRQDLPPVYMLSSGVIAVTRSSLFDVDDAHPHRFLGADRRAIVTDEQEVIDIDTELDLLIARAVLEHGRAVVAAAEGGSTHH